MIRVILPQHLQVLASAPREVTLDVPAPVTQRSVLDALESRFPMLKGTVREHVTQKRRPLVRFFACQEDLSHEAPDTPLPDKVASGEEPYFIIGAIAGGSVLESEHHIMTSDPKPVSKKLLWTGRVLSAIPALMLLFSAAMKFAKPKPVLEGFTHLGFPQHHALGLGILELACTLLYLIPQTAVLGAILLTGYLGGAVTAHVRIGEQFFMPILLGVLVWLGLFLREPRLRALIPLRKPS